MPLFHKSAWLVPAAFAAIIVSTPSKAHAIPYFARKYKTTCSRCHYAVPKLNTFGKNFQLHGYQQPGDKFVNKIIYQEDKNLVLPDQLPIAFLFENQLQLDKTAGNSNPDNLSSTSTLHIFAADAFAPDLGFFGELATSGGVTDIGKVSLTFAHLGNQNVFGQVGNIDPVEHGVTEHDLFGRSGYAVQDIGLSTGPNPWTLSAQHMGVRFYGLFGAAVTPDLIHGKTAGADKAAPAKDDSGLPIRFANQTPQKADDDMKEEKEAADPMDRLTGFLWEVGAYNSTNSSNNPVNPGPNDFSARLNMYFGGDSFIGIAGYSGLMTVGGSPIQTALTNRYRVAGPDFSFYFGKPIEKVKNMMVKPFNLLGGYLTGQADNPADDGNRVSWSGYFLEQDYMPTAKSMAFVRYDKVKGNHLEALAPTFTESLTFNYTYYLRTNFWAGLEYTHDMTRNDQSLLGLVFNFAF